jgi:hypothetical protein
MFASMRYKPALDEIETLLEQTAPTPAS